VFGQVGILNIADSKLECHVCGNYFASLPVHVFRIHGMWPEEYKVLFGLNKSTGLVGPKTANKLSVLLKSRRRNGQMLGGYLPTPEQVSNANRDRVISPQARTNYKRAANSRPYVGDKISATKVANRPERICEHCGNVFKHSWKQSKKFCSLKCGRLSVSKACSNRWAQMTLEERAAREVKRLQTLKAGRDRT